MDKNKACFRDKSVGSVSIAENKRKYFKTKDSTSPSGHSLVAQIDMTHSGIVTRNYGFYLPAKMKAGAPSFTDSYSKPIIVGHDENPLEQAEPIGRVVQADYINNTDKFVQNDRYLSNLLKFHDKKQDKTLDFVNYVIENYDGKDGYQGLGHIRGTLKITDAEAIEKVLDERYLTVSTSMSSDSASCNICGTDWVENGPCEHKRGAIYDDKVCVLIPGNMFYDHLGIVNAPADPHASGFDIMGVELNTQNDSEEKDKYQYQDEYSIAANLFAWSGDKLISLSDNSDVDLIKVKDNIQNMESAMSKPNTKISDSLLKRVKDNIDIDLRLFRYGEEGKNPKSISVSEYASSLEDVDLQGMAEKIASMMSDSTSKTIKDSDISGAIEKYFQDELEVEKLEDASKGTKQTPAKTKKKKGEEEEEEDDSYKGKKTKTKKKTMDGYKIVETEEELSDKEISDITDKIKSVKEANLKDSEVQKAAELYLLKDKGDVIAQLNYGSCDSVEDFVKAYASKDEAEKLSELTVEQLKDKVNEHIKEEDRMSDEDFGKLKSSDFCGMKGCFPVVDANYYSAAKAVLAKVQASDSIKTRILSAIERKAEKLGLQTTDSFDSNSNTCDNNQELSTEELLKRYEDAKKELQERGHEFDDSSNNEADQELQVLEAQLEAANEESDELREQLDSVQAELVDSLAHRVVDMKILSQTFDIKDRETAIKDHKERSVESLRDSMKDLNGQVDISSVKINDGLNKENEGTAGTIENPVHQEGDKKGSGTSKAGFNKDKIYDAYNVYVRKFGKKEADRWLDKTMKKNGTLPSLD